MAEATLKQVTLFFRQKGENLKDFTQQWQALSTEDKAVLKAGLTGWDPDDTKSTATLTY